MGFTLCGLLLLSVAPTYGVLLVAAALVGTGSSIFHPESSRVARMASGGQHGLAQSIFQVGGNGGSAMGPLLAAWIVHQQGSVAWFSLAALLAIAVLWRIGVELLIPNRPELPILTTLPVGTPEYPGVGFGSTTVHVVVKSRTSVVVELPIPGITEFSIRQHIGLLAISFAVTGHPAVMVASGSPGWNRDVVSGDRAAVPANVVCHSPYRGYNARRPYVGPASMSSRRDRMCRGTHVCEPPPTINASSARIECPAQNRSVKLLGALAGNIRNRVPNTRGGSRRNAIENKDFSRLEQRTIWTGTIGQLITDDR